MAAPVGQNVKEAGNTERDSGGDEIDAVDLAFVVDTTGSMGGLIAAAQRQMVRMTESASRAAAVRLRLGVVEYRDHPPQDRLVYRVHPMTADLAQAQATINRLRADGGGDGPEAVLDGVLAACQELAWRPHARRIAVLVGDAPPHGVGAPGDGFRDGCPCGQTVETVTAAAEEARVTLYALGLTPVARLEDILRREFGDLDLDRKVLAAHRADPARTIDDIAGQLETVPGAVAASMTRLGARRLLCLGQAMYRETGARLM